MLITRIQYSCLIDEYALYCDSIPAREVPKCRKCLHNAHTLASDLPDSFFDFVDYCIHSHILRRETRQSLHLIAGLQTTLLHSIDLASKAGAVISMLLIQLMYSIDSAQL